VFDVSVMGKDLCRISSVQHCEKLQGTNYS